MKLKSTFITHTTESEQLMISSDGKFNGMVRSNRTAAEIIDLLKNEITKEEIVLEMQNKYGVAQEILSSDVEKVLAALRQIGALDE